MDTAQLNGLTNFIWNIADDVLRDVYVRGKYRESLVARFRGDFRGPALKPGRSSANRSLLEADSAINAPDGAHPIDGRIVVPLLRRLGRGGASALGGPSPLGGLRPRSRAA